jgi:hypothetical protein
MGTQLPSVFISYSHDNEEHEDRVLALADSLVVNGVPVILDRYEPNPEQGWPRWMEDSLDRAGFVLLICTETYNRRVRGREEAGKGLGVRWEANLIYNAIYDDAPGGSRYVPIILDGGDPFHIPNPLKGHTYYLIRQFDLSDNGYEALYRHLTGQPEVVPPSLGQIKILEDTGLSEPVPVSKDMPFMEDPRDGEICIKCHYKGQLGGSTAHKLASKFSLTQGMAMIPRCEINGVEYPLVWGETTCIPVNAGQAYNLRVYTEQAIWGRRRFYEAELTTAVVKTGNVQSFDYTVSLGLSWSGLVGRLQPKKGS